MFELPKEILSTSLAMLRFGRHLSLPHLLDDLGPVYGKMVQAQLAYLPYFRAAFEDWPPMSSQQIHAALSDSWPDWQEGFSITNPSLGVASIAQVVGLKDIHGVEWVAKIVKPQAKTRMNETCDALDAVLKLSRPVPLRDSVRKNLSYLISHLRQETDMRREGQTLERLHKKNRNTKSLRLPKVLCYSQDILIMEKLVGTSLAKVIQNPEQLPPHTKQNLARLLVSDILIQIFDEGLFHADPHAGNFILLKDGSLGLLDWGLSGELSLSDRKLIKSMLSAVIAKDLDRLCDVLLSLSPSQQTSAIIKKELQKLKKKLKDEKNLGILIPTALQTAEKLGLGVPDSLILMMRTLLCLDSLAKNLDPEISLAKIATPILLRHYRPGLIQLVSDLSSRWLKTKN
jgi:ubiquinone biosynthesis protein